MPNVKFEHPDLVAKRGEYELIDDCMRGQEAVKLRKAKYLPIPNAADKSPQNAERYKGYLTRAVFYNVTRRTANGLVGMVFATDPTVNIPDKLKPVVQDASGGGISLDQLAKKAVREGVTKGRLGLLVDFPQVPETGLSKAQADRLNPTITIYTALEIINWRVDEVEGVDTVTLVVLKERYVESDDGFHQTFKEQYRELRLTIGENGQRVYVARIWRNLSTTGYDRPYQTLNVTGADGEPLDHIPFYFVGAENNDADVDESPIYDLASLNIAHYRNSADYEEAAYIVGQPTPWFAGLTQDWVRDVLKGKVELGSRAAVPLPENATAGMLQADERTMMFEAMQHKEEQMIAIGARLVERATIERTATDALLENAGETATVGDVARNVSTGIEWALNECMIFLPGGTSRGDGWGKQDATIVYQLNTAFGVENLPPEEIAQIIASWVAGAITDTEMRQRLRQGKLATEDDKKWKAEADKKKADADAAEVDKVEKTAQATEKAKADNAPPPVRTQ